MPAVSLDDLNKAIYELYYGLSWEEAKVKYDITELKMEPDPGSAEFKNNAIFPYIRDGRVVYAELSLVGDYGHSWIQKIGGREGAPSPYMALGLPHGGKMQLPSKGAGALPTGEPGKGGRGGIIRSSCPINQDLANLTGGDGAVTKAVAGQKATLNNPV